MEDCFAGGGVEVVGECHRGQAQFGLWRPTVGGNVQVFEYNGGRLDNSGEKVEIAMPGDVDEFGIRQYIRVDRVNYSDGSHPIGDDPWPVSADGGGKALRRIDPQLYGNDAANWEAADPKPGQR